MYSAAFSPDGRQVVTASGGQYGAGAGVPPMGKPIAELNGHAGRQGELRRVQPGRQTAVVCTASRGQIPRRVWSASDGKPIAELKGHAGPVNSAAFSPDGKQIVTASGDNTARVWNAADGKPITELKGHAAPVYSAAFSPDGKQIVTASGDKTARVWSASDGKPIAVLKGHEDRVDSAAFSPDGKQVVTASVDNTARVWSASDGKPIAELKGHAGPVYSAAFSPDGKQVVTASGDNTALRSGGASRWGSRSPSSRATRPRWNIHRRVQPGRQHWAITAFMGQVVARVWSASDGKQIAELKGHAGPVNSAAFSPDGKQVVTASQDSTARVWSASDGKPIAELKGHVGPVSSAAFSPDGKQVVTASWDKTARVWPLEPFQGDAKAFSLWVQAYTGTERQGGVIRPLSDAEWKTRCRELRAYGTKAPPSPWLDGLDLAERPARP